MQTLRRHQTIAALALLGTALLPPPARAEMKYFQIARLLNFKTNCHMEGFEDRSPPTGPGRFLVTCGNITSYPDGLVLECPDRIDEWTCRIVTEPLKFEGLDILRPK